MKSHWWVTVTVVCLIFLAVPKQILRLTQSPGPSFSIYSLEDFQMWGQWGKREFQHFLQEKGLSVKELALAFAAKKWNSPVVLTEEEKKKVRATEYHMHGALEIDGVRLLDALCNLPKGWETEDQSRSKWPCTCSMIGDIFKRISQEE